MVYKSNLWYVEKCDGGKDTSRTFSGFKPLKECETDALGLVFCGTLISGIV